MKKKVYYARHMALYGTKQGERDIELLEQLGYQVIDPDKPKYQKLAKKYGMEPFMKLVESCDVFAFRAFPDMKIGSGVVLEIEHAKTLGLPIFELPTITESRKLNIAETRQYLSYLGQR